MGRIQLSETLMGGEFGIEDEMPRWLAMLASPELDEAKNLVGFLSFTDVCIRIAEHLAIGVLREEGKDTGLASASLG